MRLLIAGYQITEDAREELLFWLCSAELLSVRSFCWRPSAARVAFSDASDTGYGGYVVELGPHTVSGCWSEDEARHSSTWRELKAVDKVLESVADKFSGHTIKWCTDNQNVVRIIQHGSMAIGSHICRRVLCAYTSDVSSMESSWRWPGYYDVRTSVQTISLGLLIMMTDEWILAFSYG